MALLSTRQNEREWVSFRRTIPPLLKTWAEEERTHGTVRRIESGLSLPHRGIRFPQNPCTTCPFIGICLDKPDLVEAGLVRKPGVDLGLFDELVY